ncbi:MAG: hypothetical protein KAI64_06815, partial [Thermoplasmata archaeon]|nr:hypothetical protein [Thermoplasmata archaeon]
MKKKSAILLSIMLVVGAFGLLPGDGAAATPHLFQAYDDATSTPQIMNATDTMDPNDGLARMHNLNVMPVEVAGGAWPDVAYPGTNDIVGANGYSLQNNSFHLDTNGTDTEWTVGDTFVFEVERDPGSSLLPQIYETGTVPNGYVASDSLAITVADPQVVGPMTLEKIPAPYFSNTTAAPLNFYVNWTVMATPNIGTYIIYEGTSLSGPWTLFEEVATPPSTIPAVSGQYYSIGINWTGGVWSLVQGASNPFNKEPDLTWTGEPGYTGILPDVSPGVSPDVGPLNCRDFEYRIVYSDPNNDTYQAVPNVHIYENSVDLGPFPMVFDSWAGAFM